jgi:hypothetical protein
MTQDLYMGRQVMHPALSGRRYLRRRHSDHDPRDLVSMKAPGWPDLGSENLDVFDFSRNDADMEELNGMTSALARSGRCRISDRG